MSAGGAPAGAPPVSPGAPALALRGITKRFGDLVANDRIDFDVRAGEVHALLGENGAGKTTAMRIAYGLTHPDSGQILVGDEVQAIRSPRDAIEAGVGMVTQHFALVRPMTVAENLVLGRASTLRLDLNAARRQAEEASARFGIRVDPAARVADLSVGEQQRVEILKALSRECRILILDEPTAVLVPDEVQALFATLRLLVGEGMAVVFISHKLAEVRAISHRITVLRRGAVVGTVDGQTDERELARMMVGRPSFGVERPADAGRAAQEPILRIRDLHATGHPGAAGADRCLAGGRRGRDRGRGRGLGQRTDRTGGSPLRDAAPDRRVDHRRRHRRDGRRPHSRHDRRRGADPRGPPRQPRRRTVGGLQPGPRAARRVPPRGVGSTRRRCRPTPTSSSRVSTSGPGQTTRW